MTAHILCPVHEFERRNCDVVCESARWELHVAAAALRNYWRQRARGQQPRHLATYRCRYDRKERDAA